MRCYICANAYKTSTTNLRKHEGVNMRPRWMRMIWIAPLAILGILLFVFIGGKVVMLLWNWLLPALFGWHTITFWQAIGLLALCRILFGGLGLHSTSRAHMSAEERARFRQRMRERFGFAPSAGESKATP